MKRDVIDDAAKPHLVLAFDYGTRRIGVACGDTLTRTAKALCVIDNKPTLLWDTIKRLQADYLPQQLVLGIPFNVDGTAADLTTIVKSFASELATRCQLPVALVDERYSSKEASEALRIARREGLKSLRVTHADVDMVAAKLILERWFNNPHCDTVHP